MALLLKKMNSAYIDFTNRYGMKLKASVNSLVKFIFESEEIENPDLIPIQIFTHLYRKFCRTVGGTQVNLLSTETREQITKSINTHSKQGNLMVSIRQNWCKGWSACAVSILGKEKDMKTQNITGRNRKRKAAVDKETSSPSKKQKQDSEFGIIRLMSATDLEWNINQHGLNKSKRIESNRNLLLFRGADKEESGTILLAL